MSRVNPRIIDQNDKRKYLDLLWTSIAGLNNRAEVKSFFKDLFSESESIMFARRIHVAQLLLNGKTYQEISKLLSVGQDTINKVQQWLTSGFGGYEKVISSFEQVLAKRENIEKRKFVKPYSFEWLKQKYPLHFLLFNLMDGIGGKNKRKALK